MRVLLVNPFYPISETPSPPLGLAYLASALERVDIEVKILDLVVVPYRLKLLESILQNFRPHILGITAVTMTFDNAMEVIRDAKRINPDILTIMGGSHVTFCAQETLNRFPELDVIALGEGEETIVDLTKTSEKHGDLKNVKGIVFRNGFEFYSTGSREFVDIDQLPMPARHLLPLGRYRALGMPISMTTSRGCPFQCIFCVGRKMGGAKVRYRNPAMVAEEMQCLKNLGFHQINIADDLFTADKKHCLAICEEVSKRNLNINWTSFARVDTVSQEILLKMKAAGCNAVSFGIESASSEILKTIKKGITKKQVIDAVKMCTKVGIKPYGSFLLGLPGETPLTLKKTLDFANQLKGMGLSYGFHLLAPFPGTEIRENHAQFGLKILSNEWSRYHANRAIVETADVSRKMLDEIVIGWEKEYDAFLDDIRIRLKNRQTTDDESQYLLGLERIVLIYDLMMGGVIEKNGSWPAAVRPFSDQEALETLVERIDSDSVSSREKIFDALRYNMKQGNLMCNQKNGQIQWQWVDNLT
jgi:radical SAM superfamily enzyme YgiQ (UPF0313 family)